jgi:hypothetical protein
LVITITTLAFLAVADTVVAAHWPADGSPRTIHGTDLVIFLIVAFWPIQFAVALLVYADAKRMGTSAVAWFVLVLIPGVGFIIALLYYIVTRIGTEEDNLTASEIKTRRRAHLRNARVDKEGRR